MKLFRKSVILLELAVQIAMISKGNVGIHFYRRESIDIHCTFGLEEMASERKKRGHRGFY